MTPTVVVHCKALGRSLDHILAHVPEAIVFEAPVAPNHGGCIAGHQHAVGLARTHGWSAVTVLEDDCRFTDAFSPAQWMADIEWARAHWYDVLNGGCIRSAYPRMARYGLAAVSRFKSAHCIAYLPAAFSAVDRLVYPMDYMIGRLGTRPLVTVPFVAMQAPSMSGHLHRWDDNTQEYRSEQARLQELVCAS